MNRRSQKLSRISLSRRSVAGATGSHTLRELASLEDDYEEVGEIDLGPVSQELAAQSPRHTSSRTAHHQKPITKEEPSISGPLGRKDAITEVMEAIDPDMIEPDGAGRDDPTLTEVPLDGSDQFSEGQTSTEIAMPDDLDVWEANMLSNMGIEPGTSGSKAYDTQEQLTPYTTLNGVRVLERRPEKEKPVFDVPKGHAIFPLTLGTSLSATMVYDGGFFSKPSNQVIDLAARLNTPSANPAYSSLNTPDAKGVIALAYTDDAGADYDNPDFFSLNFFRLERETLTRQEKQELMPTMQVDRASLKRNSLMALGCAPQMYLFADATKNIEGEPEQTLWLVDDTPDGCAIKYQLFDRKSPEALGALETLGKLTTGGTRAYDELRKMFLGSMVPEDDIYTKANIESFLKPIARDKNRSPFAAAYLANYFRIGMIMDAGVSQVRNIRSQIVLSEHRSFLQNTYGTSSTMTLHSRINYTLQDSQMGYTQHDDDFRFRIIPLMKLGSAPATVELRFGEMLDSSALTNGKKVDYANRVLLQYNPGNSSSQ